MAIEGFTGRPDNVDPTTHVDLPTEGRDGPINGSLDDAPKPKAIPSLGEAKVHVDHVTAALQERVRGDNLADPRTSMKVTKLLHTISEVRDAGVFGDPPKPQPPQETLSDSLAVDLYTGIASGEIADRLPTVKELVDAKGLSDRTVVTALHKLEEGGVVNLDRKRGISVKNRQNIPSVAEGEAVEQAVAPLAEKPAEEPYVDTRPEDPTVERLKAFLASGKGTEEQAMAASFALNTLRNAEKVVFEPATEGQNLSGKINTAAVSDRPLAHDVAKRIYTSIADQQLPDGTRIPSEMELAELHGVSRQTAREALAMLAQGGVLQVQRGNGTFVTNSDTLRRPKSPGPQTD